MSTLAIIEFTAGLGDRSLESKKKFHIMAKMKRLKLMNGVLNYARGMKLI